VKSFDYDRLRNDRALEAGKSDNNKNPRSRTRTTTRTTFMAIGYPETGAKISHISALEIWKPYRYLYQINIKV